MIELYFALGRDGYNIELIVDNYQHYCECQNVSRLLSIDEKDFINIMLKYDAKLHKNIRIYYFNRDKIEKIKSELEPYLIMAKLVE